MYPNIYISMRMIYVNQDDISTQDDKYVFVLNQDDIFMPYIQGLCYFKAGKLSTSSITLVTAYSYYGYLQLNIRQGRFAYSDEAKERM